MFSILVVLWCWIAGNKHASGNRLKVIFTWIGIACLFYGIGMEFVQKYFIKNRSFDTGDIIADGVGSALGVFFSMKRFLKK